MCLWLKGICVVSLLTCFAVATEHGRCPEESFRPKDVTSQPRGIVRLICTDSSTQEISDVSWNFNPVFGHNWRQRQRFNFTRSWTDSINNNDGAIVNALGHLVINVEDATNWTGEYLCLYTCPQIDLLTGVVSTDIHSSKDKDNASSKLASGWRRRVFWVKIYTRDPQEFERATTIFVFVGILAFIFSVSLVMLNLETIRYTLWRKFSNRDSIKRFVFDSNCRTPKLCE